MRDQEPSRTAAIVAVARGLADALPADARLALDPYGLRFAGRRLGRLARLPAPALLPARPFLLYMQLRTRAIDDVLREFAAEGGDQVLILGAGFDARAARFRAELGRARVFEVDHPATQARKRAVLGDERTTYVAWDFERRPVAELPDALAAVGHDPGRPTLTIWEGVTMYLSDAAIDASVRAVAALSAPGSPFVTTWIDRRVVEHPGWFRQVVGGVVARVGEPFTFGFDPPAFPGWMAARGWTVEWDRGTDELARRLLPPRHARWVRLRGHHVSLARRTV